MKKRYIGVLFVCMTLLAVCPQAWAHILDDETPELVKAEFIGDRVVDIACHLGVVPEAMSVQGEVLPLTNRLATSRRLRCPFCGSGNPDYLTSPAEKAGIRLVVIEDNPRFSMNIPGFNPAVLAPELRGRGFTVKTIDFSKGYDSAIRQLAVLFGREKKAEALIKRYHKELAAARGSLPEAKGEKNAIVLTGMYVPGMDKAFFQIEASGGYTDKYFLEPLGMKNVAEKMVGRNASKGRGYYMLNSLKRLGDAKPDVIIITTGDDSEVQKKLARALRKDPSLSEVPALKNLDIYCLPTCAAPEIIEYPEMLEQWSRAVAR